MEAYFNTMKPEQVPLWQNEPNPIENTLKVPMLFRASVPEIPSTTYGTFALYRYPAKFIPQVIAYVLKVYAHQGMRIFDPFAGYGTVGVVSRVYGYDYELWDLNPIMEVIHDAATYSEIPTHREIAHLIQGVRESSHFFLPRWTNLLYWHPEPFLEVLGRAWGFYHQLPPEQKRLLVIPLLNITRYFSYGDEKVHKLYKSKWSRQKVSLLLADDWRGLFYTMLERSAYKLVGKLAEYHRLAPKPVHAKILAGVDTLETELGQEVDILITSPPYLQAQEYIRSTKLEQFWLGVSEDTIKALSKKEVPYRNHIHSEIHSPLYTQYRSQIEEAHLLRLYDSYFHSILPAFARLSKKVSTYLCIFVGPAKIRTTPIPIDEILVEHLSHYGFVHEKNLYRSNR